MVDIARIPNDAAAGAEIDDTFSTAVAESEGGISGRVSKRSQRIRVFNLTIGPDDAAEVRAIHDTHRRRWPVAVRDWSRFPCTDELQTYSVEGSTVFGPLVRRITPETGTRFRTARILIPDEDETDIIISVEGTPLDRTDWVFGDLPGVAEIPVEFVAASPSSLEITATGHELCAACFTDDTLTIKVHKAESALEGPTLSIPECRLREILEDELLALLAQTDDSE